MISVRSLFLILVSIIALPSIAQTGSDGAVPGHALRTFDDPTYKVSFEFPADYTFTRNDHEISTFALDARFGAKNTIMRAVAAMPRNPFPASTFSGAYFYFSVTPRSSTSACANQASVHRADGRNSKPKPGEPIQVNGIQMTHGHDEQRDVCITQRDEIYTTLRRGTCYRFDLAINTFCGDASGVKDITQQELDEVERRLQAILSTIRFQ